VDCSTKKAALFFLACEANPATRLSIPAAMRAKWYSDVEAADRILVQQVRRESQKKAPKDTPRPKSAAASSLLALATVAMTARLALRSVAPVIVVGGIDASILPSPEWKVRKTSHQEKIGKQNERKCKAIHAQAHACATTPVAEERMKPKENRQTTVQVIAQVEGEFRARGYGVTLSKNTINRYVALGMLGTFPLVRGYEGMMPKHAFELLAFAVKSFLQISNVNSINAKQLTLMMAVNTCCGVAPAECRAKHNLYDRVMKSTNVSLNADASLTVEERHVRWTTYANLNAWFINFRAFLIGFDFASVGDDGEPTFTKAQLHRIMNIDETEISLNASNTRVGGTPAVSFHNPHLSLTSRSTAKS